MQRLGPGLRALHSRTMSFDCIIQATREIFVFTFVEWKEIKIYRPSPMCHCTWHFTCEISFNIMIRKGSKAISILQRSKLKCEEVK